LPPRPCSTRSCRRSNGCARRASSVFRDHRQRQTAALHRVIDAKAFDTARKPATTC
jgi:hypothetical protein